MTTGQSDKALAGDISSGAANYIYNQFISVVKDGHLGTAASGYNHIVWWSGNFPHNNFRAELGNKVFNTPTPAISATQGNKVLALTAVFNALYAYANQISRVRIVDMTYSITPGPDDVQSGLTALTAGYAVVLAVPSMTNLAQGKNITTAAINTFFTQLLANLASTPHKIINFCHSSCHSSCHGSRGRR